MSDLKFVDVAKTLSEEFSVPYDRIAATIALIDDGNTIPFIARYRKEVTGSLDDQVLRELYDRLIYLRGLEKRKTEVSSSIEEQGKLTEEITNALLLAKTLAEVEDIYRPYKQKRKTRASVAIAKGLQPLADLILAQEKHTDPFATALEYIDEEKGVASADDAVAGALDIIAEIVSDDAYIRKLLREYMLANSMIESKGDKEDRKSVYHNYAEFSEPVSKIAPHRVLAIDRGENEGFLKVNIVTDNVTPMNIIYNHFVIPGSLCAKLVMSSCDDSYTRLIYPSMEREIRTYLTDNAAEAAIKVFAKNLKPLLLSPPIKNKVTMGLDPGYRTGCKVAVVDHTGKVLDTGVIYPTEPFKRIDEAKRIISSMIKKHGVTVIAIGNGTASRETESFAAELLKEINQPVSYAIVSEAGASVYSASKLAAEEFPEYDVSLRSAVSIARRLQDPLAELVKIEPKSIGVGQYQHDLKKARLEEALDGVVEDCVNSVGVDLNTASYALLSRVSGIGAAVAKNVVKYREENGAFTSRSELLNVPKLGKKAYTQAAGFLRVPESGDILDNTAVHPESYKAAKEFLKLLGINKSKALKGISPDDADKIKSSDKRDLAQKIGVGEPTLNDIAQELLKPGRDPRDELPPVLLRSDVLRFSDLRVGMELMGTVRNVIDFGAFVDIGVHDDGLVHVSQMGNRYIKPPSEVLKVGDIISVKVLSDDEEKNRISLTMKS